MSSRHLKDALLRIGALALFLFLWWLATDRGWWDKVFVPAPTDVWRRFLDSLTTRHTDSGMPIRGLSGSFLWEHLGASGWRLAQGIWWALVLGVPIGLLLATVRPFRVVFEPVMSFVRSLPPLAYFSLLIIWFGIEDTSKIWLLFLAAIAPIALSIVSGVESIRPDWLEAGRSLGATRLGLIRTTVLPAVLPELLTGLRLAVGFAFTTVVAAETADGIPGIGGLAWSTKKFQQTDVAIMCVIVIGVCAVAIDLLIRALERRLVPWKGRV